MTYDEEVLRSMRHLARYGAGQVVLARVSGQYPPPDPEAQEGVEECPSSLWNSIRACRLTGHYGRSDVFYFISNPGRPDWTEQAFSAIEEGVIIIDEWNDIIKAERHSLMFGHRGRMVDMLAQGLEREMFADRVEPTVEPSPHHTYPGAQKHITKLQNNSGKNKMRQYRR